MRLRCAVLDDYQQVALSMADWSSLTDRVEIIAHQRHYADEDELVTAIADCDIVVAMRERTAFSDCVLRRLPRLRLLVTTGMHNAAIDVEAAVGQGVVVSGTASSPVPPAELTWALILALSRNVVAESMAVRNGGPWQASVGADLHGRRLGLLGLGRIGSRVARVGVAFGMDVIAWSQHLTEDRAAACGASLAPSLTNLLESSDFVSVHLRLSERTRQLLDAGALARMRRSSYLINTARAEIVDHDALVRALEERRIAGAGLDVFEVEPLPQTDVLRCLPNVLATPHLGFVTADNYRTYYCQAVEDIQAFLAGAPIRALS